MTYRYRGHSVADAGLDYRTKEEIEGHRAEHDPIRMIADRLKQRGELSEEDEQRIEEAQNRRVANAVAYAADSPAPEQDTLAEHIYADPGFKQQVARMRPGSPFGESELVFGRGLAP